MVSDLLSVKETIYLALTCNNLRHKVNRDRWKSIKATKTDDNVRGKQYRVLGRASKERRRWSVLNTLESESLNFELCHYCRILHPSPQPDPKPTLRPNSTQQGCLECDAKDFFIGRWSVWGLAFGDLAAVMSRHRNKQPFEPQLDSLRYSTEWTFADFYGMPYNYPTSGPNQFLSYVKLDTDAAIHNKHLLCHRTQRIWVPIHKQGTDVLFRYSVGSIANDLRICAHFNINSTNMVLRFIKPLADALNSVVAADNTSGTKPQDVSQQPLSCKCTSCPTEFLVTLHIHDHGGGKKSVEIVLDVWQNMGACETPNSPGWINCWGWLNPRHHKEKIDWKQGQSGVDYLTQDQKNIFQPQGGASEVSHPSSPQVIARWQRLRSSTSTVPAWESS